MKRDFRRQMKQDDLREGVQHAGQWMSGHRDSLRLGLVAALVVVLLVAGVSYLQSHRKTEAERAFDAAAEIYHAPVKGAQPEPSPAPPLLHASEKEKHEKAQAAFDGVARRYGSTAAGVRARYYAALSRLELGKFAEAEEDLKAIAAKGGGDALEPALARLALADAARRQGRTDEAIEGYRKLVDDAKQPLPRDHVLMRLATLLDEAKRPAEAREAYLRVAEEFPRSVYAPEARTRADAIDALQQA